MSRPPRKRAEKVYRPGKTQEDRMPTSLRPRVEAAEARRGKPNHMRAAKVAERIVGGK